LLLVLGACLCEEPGRSEEQPPCPADMALIPGGERQVGVQEPSEPWHETARQVALAPFCMDLYEHPNQEGALPTVDVSWPQAGRLCQAQGKRLCNSAEWEFACRGEARRRFVYGDVRDERACNTPIHGSGPPDRAALPFARAGQLSRCVSAEGVYDLNGNVSEWVQDPWTGPHLSLGGMGPDGQVLIQARQLSPEERAQDWRMLRGGTMWDGTFYGQDCTSRHGHPAVNAGPDDGLRCCRDVAGIGL